MVFGGNDGWSPPELRGVRYVELMSPSCYKRGADICTLGMDRLCLYCKRMLAVLDCFVS